MAVRFMDPESMAFLSTGATLQGLSAWFHAMAQGELTLVGWQGQ